MRILDRWMTTETREDSLFAAWLLAEHMVSVREFRRMPSDAQELITQDFTARMGLSAARLPEDDGLPAGWWIPWGIVLGASALWIIIRALFGTI